MQDSHKRRAFLKTGAKVAGGVALASMGISTLFADSKNSHRVNAGQDTQGVTLLGDSKIPFKNGERIPARGYAAFGKEWKFKPYTFTRHPLGQEDVLIEILYAGICHSDLHAVRGDHGSPIYPMVPGHEIMGKVVAVGSKVRKFKVGDYAGVGSILQQHLITNLLESRKFNVLDRDSKGYYDLEKALIKSPDAQSDEIYKLGNVLGSDYFLLFGIQGIAGQTKKSNLTNKEIHQVEIVVDYRVILFATRQIKYSNTLTMSLNLKDDNLSTNQEALKQVAQKISDDILNAIYPLKVANIANNEAVFSQTLKVGDVYECFALGEAIKDSYTKETTGRIETKVGEVTITRTNPKMSYGNITQGSVQKGNLCRPLGSSNGGGEGRDANYSINPSGGVNLGF